MLPTLLFATGAVLVLLAFWPFGPYQLTLIVARRLHRFAPAPNPGRIIPQASDDTFAIGVCAYNEAPIIAAKVEDLLRLREAAGGDLEILVYVDGATDNTAMIL